MSLRALRLPRAVVLAAAFGALGRPAPAQRLVLALAPAPRATRLTLPDVIAVQTDSAFRLLVPVLFERRQVFRNTAGVWSLVDAVLSRDSTRAASAVEGRAVALYADGVGVGTGRVTQVQPDFCGAPPAWCPPRATITLIGTLERESPHLVAVSPPPGLSADVVEPTEDEVGAATRVLFAVLRTAVLPRGRIREDQLGTPVAFAIDDRTRLRRLVVAAVPLEQSAASRYIGLVVGIAGDTLLRTPSGRAVRIAAGPLPDLQIVSALDLNGDGGIEMLLGWQVGSEWQFEILSEDAQGRWLVHWTGPDLTLPAAPVTRRRR
jgi:hypothetical protein